jgi:hypothetical protein
MSDIQHNNTAIMLKVVMMNVTFYLLLCWMSLCWVLLCWASWRSIYGALWYWPHWLLMRMSKVIGSPTWTGPDTLVPVVPYPFLETKGIILNLFIFSQTSGQYYKTFTAVIYSHSMAILTFCVVKLYYLGNYCGMAVTNVIKHN